MSTAPSPQQRTGPAGGTAESSGGVAARPAGSLGKAIAAGIAGLVLVNVLIAAVARGPLDASAQFQPLDPPVLILWTVLGVLSARSGGA